MYWIIYILALALIPLSQPWEQILLAQCWTPSYCLLNICECTDVPCSTTRDYWTVHGLWQPSEESTSRVGYCNDTWTLDHEEIRPIVPELNRLWTSISATEMTSYNFWEHEWSKHGTCFVGFKPLNNQRKYFKQGLYLMTKYSITEALYDAGILPSNKIEYRIEKFFKPILHKFKIGARISCAVLNGKQYIVDVILCFDRRFELTNCEISLMKGYKEFKIEETSVSTNCDSSKGVLYIRSVESFSDCRNNVSAMVTDRTGL